jgi:hypothetical protein
LTYFVAALRTIVADACKDTLNSIDSDSLPSLQVIATKLCNDLDELDARVILVLDAMVSISMLVSVCVYLAMYLRGDFANMLMLMVPVLVNTVLMVIACRYENAGQKLTANQ